MTRNPAWTDTEQAALCREYVRMAIMASNGQSFNKSAIRRSLMANELASRSNGSVEAKLMNCTAAALAIGKPTVPGYKAAPNYQASLRIHLTEAWAQVEDAPRDHCQLATRRIG